ncbi:MAG: hypothetical protein ACXADA_02475 [Candidatus Hodarchaeales archaeon]|jgi:hypothetical protein
MKSWEAEAINDNKPDDYYYIDEWHIWKLSVPSEVITWLEFVNWGVFPLNKCYYSLSFDRKAEDPRSSTTLDELDALEARDQLVIPLMEESWNFLFVDPINKPSRFQELLRDKDLQAVVPSPVLEEWVTGLKNVHRDKKGKIRFTIRNLRS